MAAAIGDCHGLIVTSRAAARSCPRRVPMRECGAGQYSGGTFVRRRRRRAGGSGIISRCLDPHLAR